MGSLNSLGLDVLAQISFYLSGFDVIRLWFSGNLLIRHRLEHGGVRNFDLFFGDRFSNVHMPCALSRFSGLYSLTFGCSEKHKAIDLSNLAYASSGLRILHIPRFDTLVATFINHLSHLQSLKVGIAVLGAEEMLALPQQLTTLSVMTSLDLVSSSTLPLPHLTELDLIFSFTTSNTSSAGPVLLLGHLKELSSLKICDAYAAWSPLPPHLVSLSYNMAITEEVLSQLPSSLKALSAVVCIHPSRLTLLLPRQLAKLELELDHEYASAHLSEDFCRSLPRTLTHLSLKNGHLKAQAICHLPSTLSFLSANFGSGDDRSRVLGPVQLPVSLTVLKHRGVSFEIAAPLPPLLHTISCPLLNINSAAPIEWPENVMSLTTFISESRDMRGPPTGASFRLTIEDLLKRYWEDPEEVLRLPASLTYLKVSLQRGSILTAIIPPTLTTLHIEYCSSHASSTFLPRWSKLLPSSLTDLLINGVPLDHDWLENLNLPLLASFACSHFDVTAESFTMLPQSLVYISINFFPLMDWNIDLSDLCRLRSLYILSPIFKALPLNFAYLLPKSLNSIAISIDFMPRDSITRDLKRQRIDFINNLRPTMPQAFV